MKKCDIEIGRRAYEECCKKFGNAKRASMILSGNQNYKMVYGWKNEGWTPTTFYLAEMAKRGIDVNYVLTGRRAKQ